MSEQENFDFAGLFKKMPIPRLIVRVENNKTSHVVMANDMALQYFGVKEDRVINAKISDFMDAENARHFEQSFHVCLSRKRMVTIQALPTIPGGLRFMAFGSALF